MGVRRDTVLYLLAVAAMIIALWSAYSALYKMAYYDWMWVGFVAIALAFILAILWGVFGGIAMYVADWVRERLEGEED